MQKPFHESVVDAINGADPLDLRIIGSIIVATKVPEGHDEIIAAWRAKLSGHVHDSERVVASLLAQKLEPVG